MFVSLTGKHNALNALAVFGLALELGVDEKEIRKAFETFPGVKRRMDRKGEVASVLLLDDYAHHPTEIKATLKAVRNAIGEKRLIAVFQPHRYSRLKFIMNELHRAFNDADLIVVTDLYAAGEAPVEGITTEKIIEGIQRESTLPVTYISRKELVSTLASMVCPHDVVITLGAGDVTKVGGELKEILQKTGVKKLSVALLYGGRNSEFEVSINSAKHFENNIDPLLYDMKVVEITKQGKWRLRKKVGEKGQEKKNGGPRISQEVLDLLQSTDVCIPVLHGPNGEDGKLQGFLETVGVSYTGCDVYSASICMDKFFSKQVAKAENIPTAPFVRCDRSDWRKRREKILEEVQKTLHFPVFIKPVHLGSSIGVYKVDRLHLLEKALEEALCCDSYVIIEQEVEGAREIELSVLGNDCPEVTQPGEILTHGKFYNYEAKYGDEAVGSIPCADLSEALQNEVKEYALRIYKVLGCTGLARVDFFLDSHGRWWFNEINPIPGFTAHSLYPKMWEYAGRSMKEIVDQLLILALSRTRKEERTHMYSLLKHNYER